MSLQNLQWARDVLLGSSVPWQQLKHMPAQGLFCERNKTNLFNVSYTHPKHLPIRKVDRRDDGHRVQQFGTSFAASCLFSSLM